MKSALPVPMHVDFFFWYFYCHCTLAGIDLCLFVNIDKNYKLRIFITAAPHQLTHTFNVVVVRWPYIPLKRFIYSPTAFNNVSMDDNKRVWRIDPEREGEMQCSV